LSIARASSPDPNRPNSIAESQTLEEVLFPEPRSNNLSKRARVAQVMDTMFNSATAQQLERVQADQHDLAAALGLLGCDAMPSQLSALDNALSEAKTAASEAADVTALEAAYKLVRQRMLQA